MILDPNRSEVVAVTVATIVGGAMWLLAMRPRAKRIEPDGPRLRRHAGAIPETVRDRAVFSASAAGCEPSAVREFDDASGTSSHHYPAWCPVMLVDVDESQHVVVRAELSGISPNEVALDVYDDAVVLMGDWTRDTAAGSFCRSVALPAEADTNGATVTLDDGVLIVSVPLAERNPAGDLDGERALRSDIGRRRRALWSGRNQLTKEQARCAREP